MSPDVSRKELAAKIASRLGDRLSAFRLVYEAYTRTGLAAPNPRRMRITPYQLLPMTAVLVAIDRNPTVCTMSIVSCAMDCWVFPAPKSIGRLPLGNHRVLLQTCGLNSERKHLN
jgi:hypothetical protein